MFSLNNLMITRNTGSRDRMGWERKHTAGVNISAKPFSRNDSACDRTNNKEREWRQRRRAQCADHIICSMTPELKCVSRRCRKAVGSSACLWWLSCVITGQREALFTPGVSRHPGWSDHKRTALSTGVNAPNAPSMRLKTEGPYWRMAWRLC